MNGVGEVSAHDLCSGVPDDRKSHFTVAHTGHYGIFSGRRWREMVYPEVSGFIAGVHAAEANTQTKTTRKR